MSRRKSIEIEGLSHGNNPIPLASVVGNLLISGGIMGQEPGNPKLPEDLPTQAKLMFANVRRVLEAAGGTTEDIVKVTIFLKHGLDRQPINNEWVEMFPDPASRPARHTISYDPPPGMLVQCEIIAYLDK
jgi:2-iminobutanoate/2-iminopropanoate deaminase